MVLLCSPLRQAKDERLLKMAFDNVSRLCGEKEILITKAISWVLRSAVKHHKAEVKKFVALNKDTLPKIAVRETTTVLKTGKKSWHGLSGATTILSAFLLLNACGNVKTETSTTTDSVAVELAETPAPALLAFSPMPGYTVSNTVALQDSVNFILLPRQEELDSKFNYDKGAPKPDFVINYNFAVVCGASQLLTTIVLDKVEVADAINVYLTITRGEKQKFAAKATQVFAVERREGYSTMQFFVNGRESGTVMLQ